MGVVALGRAGETLVAVGVGAGLAHQTPSGPSRNAFAVGLFVDGAGPFVGAGGYEVFGQGRAVERAVDHGRALAVGLPPELGGLVVHHQGVTERPHRQVEALGEPLGVTAVRAQVLGWPAPGADRSQHPGASAGRVLARPAEHGAEDQVGVGRHRAGRPPHGDDGGFERPVDLPSWLALGPGPLPVVSLSHVPAPIRVAGAGPPAHRRPRDHSGIGVASRPTEPSKPASSSAEHTLTEASTKSASTCSSRAWRAATSLVLNFFRRPASSSSASTLSLGPGKGRAQTGLGGVADHGKCRSAITENVGAA